MTTIANDPTIESTARPIADSILADLLVGQIPESAANLSRSEQIETMIDERTREWVSPDDSPFVAEAVRALLADHIYAVDPAQAQVDWSMVRRLKEVTVSRFQSGVFPEEWKAMPDPECCRQIAISEVALMMNTPTAGAPPMTAEMREALVAAVIAEMFGLGRLQALLDDDRIENIDINGCDEVWATFTGGEMRKMDPVADSDEELIRLTQVMAARKGHSERQFSASHPELDLRLPDGSRLSAVMAVCERPALSIRRHRLSNPTLEDLLGMGMIDETLVSVLRAVVRSACNVMVAGPPGAGKTTLLRAMATCIPPYERLVTVEQSFELGLDKSGQHPNCVALEAREANSEGVGAVTMRQLVRRTKRMNTTRVIVGEVLSDEIIDMLTAMLQGQSGSLCTIHSDSAEGTLVQAANYAMQSPDRPTYEQALTMVAQAVDIVVYVSLTDMSASTASTTDADGASFGRRQFRRAVSEVMEVTGHDVSSVQRNLVFVPDPDTGNAVWSGVPFSPKLAARLARNGFDQRSLL